MAIAVHPMFTVPVFAPSAEDEMDDVVEELFYAIKDLTRKRGLVVETGLFHDSQYDITIARRALISETDLIHDSIKPEDLAIEIVYEVFEKIIYISYIQLPKSFYKIEQFRDVITDFAIASGAQYIVSGNEGILELIFPPEELVYIRSETLTSINRDNLTIVFRGSYFELRYNGRPFYIFYPTVFNNKFMKELSKSLGIEEKENNLINLKRLKLQRLSPSKDHELLIQIKPSMIRHYKLESRDLENEIHDIALDIITSTLEFTN